jgi:iron complex outermembrane receptor protein
LSDPVAPLVLGGLQFTPAGVLEDNLKTYDVDFQHRFRLGPSHGIVWGVGFRHTHDVVANAPGLAFLPATLDQQLYSAFLQDEILLRSNLALTLGSKIEHNDYTGLELEPSVRLQWQPIATQTLWGAVSRAVRTPSRIDRDLFQAAPPYLALLQGRSTFVSENVVAYEAGFRAQLSPRVTTSLATFYNRYSDVRSTRITPLTVLPFYFANDLAGHSYGLELSGDVQLADNWSLHAGYNLLKSELRARHGQIDLSNGLNETADPEHQVALRTSAMLAERVELHAGLRWVDTLHNNNGPDVGNVPSYMELDARVAWRFSEELDLSVTGHNLLHSQHAEYGFPGPARTEVQRSVFGKLTWRR